MRKLANRMQFGVPEESSLGKVVFSCSNVKFANCSKKFWFIIGTNALMNHRNILTYASPTNAYCQSVHYRILLLKSVAFIY